MTYRIEPILMTLPDFQCHALIVILKPLKCDFYRATLY